MFANNGILILATVSAILLWLFILSLWYYRTLSRFNKFGRGVTKQNLSTLLEKILAEIDLTKKDIDQITQRCDTIEQQGVFHVQKIGILRFNPFSDTGGDQSFILAILNGKDDGILLSSLHGRTGTRWYAKSIKKGKGVEHELSHEEKQVIVKAKPIGQTP